MENREERENRKFLRRLIISAIVLLICTIRMLVLIGVI